MDPIAKKATLRLFTYGLYAVTARHKDEVAMMTANFITQSAFDPPRVALAVEADSKTRRVIEASGALAINVFESGQRELAGQLGRQSIKAPDKTEGVEWTPGPVTGSPLLAAALAWLECRVAGQLPSGDHVLFVAEVVEAGVNRQGTPLTMAEAGFKHSG